jgi:hypothetical protein
VWVVEAITTVSYDAPRRRELYAVPPDSHTFRRTRSVLDYHTSDTSGSGWGSLRAHIAVYPNGEWSYCTGLNHQHEKSLRGGWTEWVRTTWTHTGDHARTRLRQDVWIR